MTDDLSWDVHKSDDRGVARGRSKKDEEAIESLRDPEDPYKPLPKSDRGPSKNW